MAIRYIRVNPIADMFTPVSRPTGNVAIIGMAGTGATVPANVGREVSDPTDTTLFGAGSDLTNAIALAYRQTPGPSLVYGIRLAATTPASFDDALTVAEGLPVQFVIFANTPLNATTGAASGAIGKLSAHVETVSRLGADGKERMGVAMLTTGVKDPSIVSGALVNERMVYTAHRSAQDVAAAVAGTIAGYSPPTSMLLKPVAVDMPDQFSDADIEKINGQEPNTNSPPAGQGVNWLVDPPLIAGRGLYLGEGYTGNPGGKKFVDVVRALDDISYQLKANLIRSIGSVRISRSGLQTIVVRIESVLDPYVQDGVVDRYEVVIPVLVLLEKDPSSLTPAQLAQIKKARDSRLIEMTVLVVYQGAAHRIGINLKFE